ncbi:protein tipE [Diaphorina citri]|uniref:Protein tipE n=1 Tax=Diaphorina citri TaxID=121845 RepID=A0A1S3D2V6_DIACI|nr:protein tipE [Diaphorina citri]KAI5700099.1 hypothetical protein M8J75_014280 [Diaphorina citri]KAI5731257.1 hypothetical protein M8J77_007054 [Diaphorina citri]
MAEEAGKESSREKLLFYTTAFFILLAIFSLFGFLFLVPFVIEPACTTIMREFDEVPATCETIQVENLRGASNCSWTSCREGCTREIYECTQITVSYKVSVNTSVQSTITAQSLRLYNRFRRAVLGEDDVLLPSFEDNFLETPAIPEGNSSEWDFVGAKFFPNVKGCGYPPYLNCSIFHKKYAVVGKQYPCYYSTVEPALVIEQLDMWRVYMKLVLATAIPIPSFIVSVIYLTLAYIYIYQDRQQVTPRRKPTPKSRSDSITSSKKSKSLVHVTPIASNTPVPPATSGALTPNSEVFRDDMASFGHELKYAMADDIMMSNDGLDSLTFINSNSNSMNGHAGGRMMTTCILTPPGPKEDM